ncbi:L-serine ammonia-lyase [Roseibacillus ishigakijimensis]|uniref:L-serine dehydratase n=1 Tax=Roseibacillus ishigakijimensis TaxID=454146 RepID=A0A934RQD1_9BACT|nr:L-serine ammonia-lyase [Roseibacillus ishigakijimensis]MBK1833533.1 L-serine ammonia-lyase [Roseibacillus ishigakijimensis]
MSQSVLDFFSIGVGPSSSHTVGPMKAAAAFVHSLSDLPVARLSCDLYGSLAATGKGHGTDGAILLGFLACEPATLDVDRMPELLEDIRCSQRLTLPDGREIAFQEDRDLSYHPGINLPHHPNGLHFAAMDEKGHLLIEAIIYSVGGGFIIPEEEWEEQFRAEAPVPYPFRSAKELMAHGERTGLSIADLIRANEETFRPAAETAARLDHIWATMRACIERGCQQEGELPGGLRVRRRAKALHERFLGQLDHESQSLSRLDWVNLYALAVNEENAAGSRVVTAPTNGAAGIIPAVLRYAERFVSSALAAPTQDFLLTAGAMAALYKRNASISGADVGCQGEVGVACSMAAAGLAAWMGGTLAQVECAAEIGMEHNLGLTCDPIGGLVQIPCIERNAMGAVKAINAARLALSGDGHHLISLDRVIATMRETGRDMMDKYKETAQGGLAVSVVEC